MMIFTHYQTKCGFLLSRQGKKNLDCKQKGFEDIIYAHVAAHLYFEPELVGKIMDSLDLRLY